MVLVSDAHEIDKMNEYLLTNDAYLECIPCGCVYRDVWEAFEHRDMDPVGRVSGSCRAELADATRHAGHAPAVWLGVHSARTRVPDETQAFQRGPENLAIEVREGVGRHRKRAGTG